MVQAASLAGRLAAGAGLRAAGWGLETSMRVGSRLLRAAITGESPAALLREVGPEMRRLAYRLLDIADQVDGGEPAEAEDITDVDEVDPGGAAADPRPPEPPPSLRERGADLLRRSADVDLEEDAHPAYARILSELAPDEGRILRMLTVEGPQPSVDVRTARPLNIGSQLVAPGLNMIGAEAGCRHVERVPAYLNNLYRLGLIWFSREPLGDPLRYQVLEAQPDVIAAIKKAGRASTVRRSVHLTPFGEDFCSSVLPVAEEGEEDEGPDPERGTREAGAAGDSLTNV
jgi:abortive infection alpha-like protein